MSTNKFKRQRQPIFYNIYFETLKFFEYIQVELNITILYHAPLQSIQSVRQRTNYIYNLSSTK